MIVVLLRVVAVWLTLAAIVLAATLLALRDVREHDEDDHGR